MVIVKPMAKPLRARRNLKYTLRRAPKRGFVRSQTISKSNLREISIGRRLPRINKHTASNNSQISVAKPPKFRKNLKKNIKYTVKKRKLNTLISKGKKPSKIPHIDKYILSAENPHLEQVLLLDGKIKKIYNVSLKEKRRQNTVSFDLQKLETVLQNRTKKKINNPLLVVHTHPGENKTGALPSFNDIRGKYIRYIYDFFNETNQFKDHEMIVGNDTANDKIAGRTTYKISESRKKSLLKRYNNKLKSSDYPIAMQKLLFQLQVESIFNKLRLRTVNNIDNTLNEYRSKHKNATIAELDALYRQEYLRNIKKHFGVEVNFQAEPGYRLNTNDYYFEKV